MTANHVHRKKSISFTDNIFNKTKQYHMFMSGQYFKTPEHKIEYTEISSIIDALTMIKFTMEIFSQQ